mmetsp:Transcript_64612/g.203968  ORF Transcript_64612/g.203968 Transcript_64612/m.203968 type:complete len:604 (-) Transcript_64612:354-2165(-)
MYTSATKFSGQPPPSSHRRPRPPRPALDRPPACLGPHRRGVLEATRLLLLLIALFVRHLLRTALDVLPVWHVPMVVVVVALLLLVVVVKTERHACGDAHVRGRHVRLLDVVRRAPVHPLQVVGRELLEALEKLLLALLQHLAHRLVREGDYGLPVHLYVLHLLCQVLRARLELDEGLGHPLVFLLAPLAATVGLPQVGLVLVHYPAAARATGSAVLELLHTSLGRSLLLVQLVDARLRLLGHLLEVGIGILLCHELLDHLGDVAHPRRLLDLAERLAERRDLLLLLLHLLHVGSVEEAVGDERGLHGVLLVRAQVPRRLGLDALALLLPRLDLGRHLLLGAHLRPPLRELLLALHALLVQLRIHFGKLRLGHVLCVVGVMRHEDQFLQVTLLGFEGALDGRKLVVKAHSLLLEALDDLLIGAADGLRLVVLDQRLVEAVLQHADVPRHRAVLVQGAHRIALQVLHAVGHLVELPVEAVRHLHDVIASLAQVINIRRELAELGIDSSVVGIGLAPLARGQGRELRAELLVLLLSVGDGLHVLLHRPLRRLVERLPVALCARRAHSPAATHVRGPPGDTGEPGGSRARSLGLRADVAMGDAVRAL